MCAAYAEVDCYFLCSGGAPYIVWLSASGLPYVGIFARVAFKLIYSTGVDIIRFF